MSVKTELEALANENGLIHASEVVDWAQNNPTSELHRKFDWRVEEAAYAHWVWTARQLIAVYVISDEGQRQTISLVSDRKNGGGYRDLDKVLTTKELRAEAVRQALDELQRWQNRYVHLTELKAIFTAFDRTSRRAGEGSRETRAQRPSGREDRPTA